MLRRRMSVIPQDPVIFKGSLRFNLDPFNEASDADVWRVLREVHLAARVEAAEAGLEAAVDEAGMVSPCTVAVVAASMGGR